MFFYRLGIRLQAPSCRQQELWAQETPGRGIRLLVRQLPGRKNGKEWAHHDDDNDVVEDNHTNS